MRKYEQIREPNVVGKESHYWMVVTRATGGLVACKVWTDMGRQIFDNIFALQESIQRQVKENEHRRD